MNKYFLKKMLFTLLIILKLVFYLHVSLCESMRSVTGVTDSSGLPYVCWKLNQGSLEKQPVL